LSKQPHNTVYVPLDCLPPFPAVIVPVGHSGKQFEDYYRASFLQEQVILLSYLIRPGNQVKRYLVTIILLMVFAAIRSMKLQASILLQMPSVV